MILYKWRHRPIGHSNYDVTLISKWIVEMTFKGLSKTVDNSLVAMVADLWRHWCRTMTDTIKSLKIENFQWLYKLKFFQQKLKLFQNFFSSHLFPCHIQIQWRDLAKCLFQSSLLIMTTCMGNSCSPGCRWWCLWWRLFVLSLFPTKISWMRSGT